MSLPDRTEFLIVGAGPTGLACALSLHIHGCSGITVVDAVEHGQDSSRALVIHSATLEALSVIGCAEPLIEAGDSEKMTVMRIWDGTRFHNVTDFSTLAPYTKYPFALVIPQYETERILGEQVQKQGIKVCRPYQAIGMKIDEDDTNMTEVTFEDGHVVRARYVIGADGARSAIRQAAGIRFEDPTPVSQSGVSSFASIVLADVTFTETPPPEFQQMALMFTPLAPFLYVPLPASAYGVPERVYRIGSGVPQSLGTLPDAPSVPYLQELFNTYGPGNVQLPSHQRPVEMTIAKNLWSTQYKTHSSIADTFFTRLGWQSDSQYRSGGVVLLVGDAAHTHSPIGGQGMNLGLRDAISLGAALATHLSSSALVVSPSEYRELDTLLTEWALNRKARGLSVIGLTKAMLKVGGLTNETTWFCGVLPIKWIAFRNFAFRIFAGYKVTQRFLAWRLSGLGNR